MKRKLKHGYVITYIRDTIKKSTFVIDTKGTTKPHVNIHPRHYFEKTLILWSTRSEVRGHRSYQSTHTDRNSGS